MQADKHELDHLQNGDVSLPPQVFLDTRTHRRHHVVKIHCKVYERVTRQIETVKNKEFR